MRYGFQKGNIPWNKGKEMPEETKIKVSEAKKKNPTKYWSGKEFSSEHRKKLSIVSTGRCRELAGNWDGGKSKNHHSTTEPRYKEWRGRVFTRDDWKCVIDNQSCKGQIQAHHILPWRDFPELRYEINNGITLCQAHHPRKRAEEKRLIPFFSGLVSVS